MRSSTAVKLDIEFRCAYVSSSPWVFASSESSVVEEALLLNPFNPNAWSQNAVIALAQFGAGRYQEALGLARQALSRRPSTITAHLTVVAALVALDRTDEATAAYRAHEKQRPDFAVERHLELIAPVAEQRYIEQIRDAFRIVAGRG